VFEPYYDEYIEEVFSDGKARNLLLVIYKAAFIIGLPIEALGWVVMVFRKYRQDRIQPKRHV